MTLPCHRELVFLIGNSDGLKPERLIPQVIDNNNFRSLLLMGFQQAVPDLLVFPFHLLQICPGERQQTAEELPPCLRPCLYPGQLRCRGLQGLRFGHFCVQSWSSQGMRPDLGDYSAAKLTLNDFAGKDAV